MFLKQATGQLFAWSVFSLATRVVRESGQASTLEDVLRQASTDEDVFVGQALPNGTVINEDGSIVPASIADAVATPADVKAEVGRRLAYTDWYFTRAAEDPSKPVPDDILAERKKIRDRAEAIEALDPIPADFRNWDFWN